MNLELIYALHQLDEVFPESLPEIAIQLIEEGYDNEHLILLAGLNKPSKEETKGLVEKGIYPLLKSEANKLRIDKIIAKAILEEEISPYKGAGLLVNNLYGQDGYEYLKIFHHLIIEYEDYEQDIYLNQFGNRTGDYKKWLQEVIQDIIIESKKLLEKD